MAVAYAEYAGVKLPLWTPDCDRALAAAGLNPDRVHRFDAEPDTTGLQGLPLPPRAEPPPFRGGTLWWPLGASQWARAHFVVDAATLTAIRAALVTASGANAGYVAATFKLSDGRGGTDWSGALHLLPPIPIVGTDDSYLLTLVDERYYWWFRPTISLSAVTTWSGVYSAIGTGIGSTVTVDGSLSSFAAPSTRWQSLGGQPLPLLLDAAAWCTGRRIVRRADGTVRATDYATAKAAAAAVQSAWGSTYRRRGGGQPVAADAQKSAPASVLVRSGSLSQMVTLSSLAIADYGSVTGKSGYRATLNTDAATLTTGEAEALAREWYQWLLAREDVSFAGVAAFTTNGWYGAVEYAFRRDEVGTRILPPPFEFGHSSGSDAPATASGTLATRNLNGTQIGTTTDMRFDQSQGVNITQGGSGFDTVSLSLATRTQRGVWGVSGDGPSGLQKFSGRKLVEGSTWGITVDTGAVDHTAMSVPLGFVYADTTLTNFANGVWATSTDTLVRSYVNAHDTITSPGTLVDRAAVWSQAQIGATPNAFVQALVYDATLANEVSASVYSLKTGVCGVSFSGGAPTVPFGIYYDQANAALDFQITDDLTFAASQGPVVRSPNGNRWRLTVDNTGVVSATGPL